MDACGHQPNVVVYIEDNPTNVALMEDLMSDVDGVQLLTAPNAELGLQLVRQCAPRVVIMDLNLPGMDGFEATERLHAAPETRDIPVIALSSLSPLLEQRRVQRANFYHYLTKPLNIDAFRSVLDTLLASSAA